MGLQAELLWDKGEVAGWHAACKGKERQLTATVWGTVITHRVKNKMSRR